MNAVVDCVGITGQILVFFALDLLGCVREIDIFLESRKTEQKEITKGNTNFLCIVVITQVLSHTTLTSCPHNTR